MEKVNVESRRFDLGQPAVSGDSIEPGKVKPSIRVLAVDSAGLNGERLADELARDKRFRVVSTNPSGAAILAATAAEKPDVAILCLLLDGDPSMGFQVARQLRELHPATRIVMLLDRSERGSVLEAFRAGASGTFSRAESPKCLPRCVSCVHAGQVWANSRELKYLIDDVSASLRTGYPVSAGNISVLTKREQDVVQGVADGLSNRKIAHRLNLTEHTVKNYLFRVFEKLDVSSRVEVVLYAFGLPGASLRKSVTNPRKGRVRTAERAKNSSRKGSIKRRRNDIAPERQSRKELPL